MNRTNSGRHATGRARPSGWRRLGMGCLFFGLVLAATIASLLVAIRKGTRVESAVSGWIMNRMLVGPVATWWGPLVRTAAVHGEYAYVGMGTSMGVVDLHDVARPKLLDVIYIGGIVHGFCQTEEAMFVGAGPSGLTAFDIRDPAHPKVLDRYRSFGYGMHCALQEGMILFSNEMDGWALLDVRDPSRMRKLAERGGGWVSAATMDGTIAYVLDGRTGVDVFDLSDPRNPVQVGNVALHLPPEYYEPDPPPIWLELQGGHAFVSNGSDGFRILDVADPRRPRIVGHLPLEGYTYTVAVRGDRAYLANINLGLVIVDISRPEDPRPTRICETPGGAYDVILRGDRGYLSDGANGFLIFDVREKDAPRPLGYLLAPPATRGVTLAGDTLFMANQSAGIDIYDVSQGGPPRLLSHLETKGLANQVAVMGDRAVVADVLAGAQLVDLRDPTNPRITATFIPEDHPWGITIDGDFGYVANGHHGFSVLDMRPEIPEAIANDYTRLGSGFGYLIRSRKLGNLALATDIINGLFIYDVSDPAHLRRLANYPHSLRRILTVFQHRAFLHPAIQVDAAGSTVYLAGYDRGLEILDVSDPTRPRLVGEMPTAGHAYGVSYRDGRAAVSEYEGRVHLVDVSDPRRPRRLRSWEVRGTLHDVILAERKIYVAAGPEGLAVVDLESGSVEYVPMIVQDQTPLVCRDPDAASAGGPVLVRKTNVLPVALGGGPAPGR